jgi:hypothetical protein
MCVCVGVCVYIKTYLIPQLGLVPQNVVLVEHDKDATLGTLVHEGVQDLPGGFVLFFVCVCVCVCV